MRDEIDHTAKTKEINLSINQFFRLTAIATYLFTSELKDSSAGLLAAAFIGIAPGYISRSVAGSYDNEGVAIFALMIVFWMWLKALKTGSAFWGLILFQSFLSFPFLLPSVNLLISFLFFFSCLKKIDQKQSSDRSWLFLHGLCLGWICFHHQHDPSSCFHSYFNGALHQSPLCCLLHRLHLGHHFIHANSLHWFPTCANF